MYGKEAIHFMHFSDLCLDIIASSVDVAYDISGECDFIIIENKGFFVQDEIHSLLLKEVLKLNKNTSVIVPLFTSAAIE